jgi:gliding motility-associated-like protein
MKKYTLSFFATLLVLICTLFNQEAKASHSAGGELTYAWIGGTTYRITLKFYRDCTGITVGNTFPLCVSNSCGPVTGTFPPNLIQVGPPTRANSNCSQTTCDNPASTVPGYEEYIYQADVTLPTQCNSWTFATYLSARNPTVNLNPSPSNFYVEAVLNNVAAQGNSSPTFSVRPVPFVCINKRYNYNNGVGDVNNDSLVFEMVRPRSGDCNTNEPIGYALPPVFGEDYDDATNPLLTGYTFNLNATNGQMSFIPNTAGQFGIAMRVKEYRNGVLIGAITRDIQVIVRTNCPNIPDMVFGPDLATSTNVTVTPRGVEGCVNKPLNLCVRASNQNANVKIELVSNNVFSAPGSVLTVTGGGTDTALGCIGWTPAIADTGLHNITFSVTDTNCATNGGVPITQTYVLPLYINPVTTASPDVTICNGGTAPLRVVGGGDWIWTALPGGSPVSSLSCTECQEPVASPLVTTTYVVTARTSNAFCNVNTDTVTVYVAPSAGFTLGPDITTCVNNSVQLNAVVDPGAGTNYTINWTPATSLSNPNIVNPIVRPSADQTYIVKLTPAGVSACATYDTLRVNVLQGYTFENPDTAICKGASIPVRFNGDTRYTYTWTPAIGVTDVNIGNPVITPDTSRTYVLTATYPGCRDSVKSLYVDVQPIPLVYAGVDQIICYGDTVHLDAAQALPATYPNYTYSWSPAGSFNNPARLNPIFTGYQTTTTILTVTTPAGCTALDSATYTVVPTSFLTVSADTAICPGDSAQLRVGGPYRSIAWGTNTYISDTLSANPYVYPITTSTYTLTGRDSNFCLDTASVVVVVRPGALISLPDSVTIFPGETYAINPAGNGLYFSWFPQGGLSAANIANPIASPAVNTRYYVTATTEAGCSVRDSIDVNVSLDSYVDVPNAFTPGSAPNALFKLVRRGNVKVNSFKVFNRWGAQMFSTNNPDEGWNGQLNGQPQPMGAYVYIVDVITPTGRHFYKQGSVTLIR